MGNIIINDLWSFLKPEIFIAGGIFIILLADLVIRDNRKAIHFTALIILIAAFASALLQMGTESFIFYLGKGNNHGLLAVDPMSTFIKLITIFSTILIVIFTITSEEFKGSKFKSGEFYTLLFGMLLGMLLLSSGADLIIIYVSLELLSLSSYVLAGFIAGSNRSSEASLKYVIYGATSSGIMLFGISILYGLTGTTNLYAIHAILVSPHVNYLTLGLSILMIFTGIGFKISAVPFHFWTPDVYEGSPLPVTAYLSVASKAAGFALLIRFIKVGFISSVGTNGFWNFYENFDWQLFLIILSVASMTVGNLTALWQNNVKRMLAYSSIAHAGYMLLAIAVLSEKGMLAFLVYIAIYMFMNLGVFYAVMLVANKKGNEEISSFAGLGYKNPYLAFGLSIFLISLTGIPPTGGFIGKLYLFIALLDGDMYWPALIALLNTVISLYYYVRIIKEMYLTKALDDTTIETSKTELTFMFALVAPILVFGIYFTPLVNFCTNFVRILGF